MKEEARTLFVYKMSVGYVTKLNKQMCGCPDLLDLTRF